MACADRIRLQLGFSEDHPDALAGPELLGEEDLRPANLPEPGQGRRDSMVQHHLARRLARRRTWAAHADLAAGSRATEARGLIAKTLDEPGNLVGRGA